VANNIISACILGGLAIVCTYLEGRKLFRTQDNYEISSYRVCNNTHFYLLSLYEV